MTSREVTLDSQKMLLLVLSNGVRLTLDIHESDFSITNIESSPIEPTIKAYIDNSGLWAPLLRGKSVPFSR